MADGGEPHDGSAPPRWVVLDVAPPARGALRAVEVEGHALLIANVDGRCFAIEDRCPHAHVALSAGSLRGAVLECPLHGGRVDVRDGAPKAPPIRRAARCYALRERDGRLEVALPG